MSLKKIVRQGGVLFGMLALLFLLSKANLVQASPPSPRVHILIQADGSTFEARQWGDEWSHGWETLSGYTILFDKTSQNWVYATLDKENNRLVPTGILVNEKDAVKRYNLVPHLRPTSVSQGPEKVLPTSGTLNLPVILVNFNDTSTTNTASQFQSLLFDTNPSTATGPGSFRDYYNEISYGTVTMSAGAAGVTGWYTSTNTHDHYGANDTNGDDEHPAELVREAVQAADADINFANYDNDNDGEVDVVVIIHQGLGEEDSGQATDIWSHRSNLSDAGVGTLTLDGKTINDYVIQPERQNNHITTIGVFAHEIGHAFGLPDLYDTDNSSDGIGNWGLMGSGSWLQQMNAGDSPAHMMAWSKATLSWITPQEVTSPLDDETIQPVENNNDIYQLLKNPSDYDWITNSWFRSGEYFLVENRQKIGFDVGLPGSGLLIWHIDEGEDDNADDSHRLVDLEEQDNTEGFLNEATDVFADCDNCFLEVNNPNSDLYNDKHSGVNVVDISASSSSMTADLMPHQIVFVVDDTGSMSDEIADVKTTINDKIDEFVANDEAEHYTVITFKDAVTTIGQSANADTAKSWINGLYASGGGDCPEASLEAVQQAADIAPTSDAWLMTDASPHGGPVELAATIAKLVANRVKLYPVILDWCFEGRSTTETPLVRSQTSGVSTTDDSLGGATPYSELARETGGHMFHVSSSEVSAVTDIILNEMDANADLSLIYGNLDGGSQTYNVLVDGTMDTVNFLLNSEESTSLNLMVRYPNGTEVQTSDPGVSFVSTARTKYYSADTPAEGVWQVEISGIGGYAFSSSASSSVNFGYLSETDWQVGNSYLLQAYLEGPDLSDIQFGLIRQDGTVEVPIYLYDNETSGDEVAGDNVFTGYYTPSVVGNYYMKVEGFSGGSSISRVDTILISIKGHDIYLPLLLKSYSPSLNRLTGTVTDNGSPVYGTELLLRYYDGSTWSTYAITTTDSSGNYQFSDLPNLGPDQELYVLWLNNSADPEQLASWSCSIISASTTDPGTYQCSFDVNNIDLLSPASGVSVSLPQTFSWSKRSITTDDYELNLIDISGFDPWWWTDPSLGYIDSYTLNGLPSGFLPDEQYGWFIGVRGPNGMGFSYYYHVITFSPTGVSEVEALPLPDRIFKENIEPIALPRPR